MGLEALAALSVASSVVQFVDFSVKIISKGNKYYRSTDGALVENTELVATVETFRRLNDGLTKSLRALGSQARSLSNEEKALQSVAQNCVDSALTLRQTVDRLRIVGKTTRWKSVRQASKTHWSTAEIEQMLEKLRSVRGELVIHLLVVIK